MSRPARVISFCSVLFGLLRAVTGVAVVFDFELYIVFVFECCFVLPIHQVLLFCRNPVSNCVVCLFVSSFFMCPA